MTTGLLITTAGQAAIAADLGGGANLSLTHVAWGDASGVPYNPTEAQTALVNERYRATIAAVSVVAGAIIVDAIIPADTNDASNRPSHGFAVAECGLFASDGTLIGVARMGNGYKPSPASGQASIATFRLKLAVANPSAITVVIDPQAQLLIGRNARPFFIVVDGVLNAPPGSPATGATYVIGAAPTGAWAGFAHRLAQWVGVWSLAAVPAGHLVVDQSQALDHASRYLRRTDTGWTSAAAASDSYGVTRLATLAEMLAGTSDLVAATPAQLNTKGFILRGTSNGLFNNVETRVQGFTSARKNLGNSTLNATTGIFTCGTEDAGDWLVGGVVHTVGATDQELGRIYKNSTEITSAGVGGLTNQMINDHSLACVVTLAAGDTLELRHWVYRSDGASSTWGTNVAFWAHRIGAWT